MLAKKTVGRNAAAFKYDLLTVMGAFGLAQEKGRQRLVLRLMTLVTARYNWARDELAVGQRGNWDTSVAEIGSRLGIFKKHNLQLQML